VARYLGSFYCDRCSHGMRIDVWLLEDCTRLCREHYEEQLGVPPPRAPSHDDLKRAPSPPLPTWQPVVPGLRARQGDAGIHSLLLQRMRPVQLGQDTEVGDGSWTLGEADLVELVLLASAYRYSPEPLKTQVRLQLFRLIHGKESP